MTAEQLLVGRPVERVCRQCGNEFTIDEGEQQHLAQLATEFPNGRFGSGWRLPTRCKPCRRGRQLVREEAAGAAASVATVSHVCPNCGDVFEIDSATQDWFLDRGLRLPSRCAACRRARRQARLEAGGEQ